MKYTLITLLIFAAIGIVWASQVTDQMQTLVDARDTAAAGIGARAAMQTARRTVTEVDIALDAYVAEGAVQDLPAELKQEMNAIRLEIKAFALQLNDPNRLEFWEFTPE